MVNFPVIEKASELKARSIQKHTGGTDHEEYVIKLKDKPERQGVKITPTPPIKYFKIKELRITKFPKQTNKFLLELLKADGREVNV